MTVKEGKRRRKPELELEAVIEDRAGEITELDLAVQRQIIEFLLELYRQKRGKVFTIGGGEG